MQSEVQRLLAQIDAEVESAERGLLGTRMVGGHDFVMGQQQANFERWAEQVKGMFESINGNSEKKAR